MESANDLSRYFSSASDQNESCNLFSNTNSISSHLRFPSYRSVLWDRKPVVDLVVNINVERFLPAVVIPLHILEQIYQYTQNPGEKWSGALLGRYKSTGDSHVFNVDKFAAQRPEKTPLDSADIQTGELSMYDAVRRAIVDLQSDDFPSKSSFINIFCQFTKEVGVCSLHGHIVAPAPALEFVQIRPLRILNNPLGEALQKGNLALPMNSVFQFGYLTLDQVRNAVPLTYNDALAFKWPLIGIWIYGQESDITLQSVHVWASCMRFLYNQNIQDRVSPEPMTFLVLLVHPGPHNAVFYECRTTPSNDVLKLFNFGMTSIHLGSQTKSELCFRWSYDCNDQHHSDFQSALNNYDTIDTFNCNGCHLDESRISSRSASVPPLRSVESEFVSQITNTHLRSKSVSPPNTMLDHVAPSVSSFSSYQSPRGANVTSQAADTPKHSDDKPKPQLVSSESSAFMRPDCSVERQPDCETHPISHQAANKSVPVVPSTMPNGTADFPALLSNHLPFTDALPNDLLNAHDDTQNTPQPTDYGGLSPLTLLEVKRQVESLQQQINLLRESLQHSLPTQCRNLCCCRSSATPHSVESDISNLERMVSENIDRLAEQQESTAGRDRLSEGAPAVAKSSHSLSQNSVSSSSGNSGLPKPQPPDGADCSNSPVFSADSAQESRTPSTVSTLKQPQSNDSAGNQRSEPSDTYSVRSRISSNMTSSQSRNWTSRADDPCELNSVCVEIRSPVAERTAVYSAGPENSSSSNADSKVIDSVSEYSWSSNDVDRDQASQASQRQKSKFWNSKRSNLAFASSSAENDVFDIPRIHFVSSEESSSENEYEEITRRYLDDKFSSDIVSEETNAEASYMSKYLLHFPDKA